MEKASRKKVLLLQYHDAIKAATEIRLDYSALTPEELISMFMVGEFEPTHSTPEEQLRQSVKGGKDGKPKGQSQKRVEEYDEACAQYEEELYDIQLAEMERKKDLEKQKEREVEGETSKQRIGEVVLKVDITDSDREEDTERDSGIQPGDIVVQREVKASDARENPAAESGQSSQQESCTYYVQVKEKVDITQKKREQLENVIKCVLQSKPKEITARSQAARRWRR